MTNNKKIVFQTDWFTIEQENYDHIDSLQGMPYYRIIQPDGVMILALTEDNEIILVQQFRPAPEKITLELPSGEIAKAETPQEAAARELYEETGYRCTTLSCIGEGRTLVNRFNSFAGVAFFGHFLLGDSLKATKIVGIVLIVLGIVTIDRFG